MDEKLCIQLDIKNEEQIKAFQWCMSLCKAAGKNEAFLANFWNRLVNANDFYEEFCYYMLHQDYLCKAKVCGYSIIDVMIWQMDHFKAQLDQDTTATKQNGDNMLLMAFDTLLKMKENPEPYVNALQTDTGTDYLGKY